MKPQKDNRRRKAGKGKGNEEKRDRESQIEGKYGKRKKIRIKKRKGEVLRCALTISFLVHKRTSLSFCLGKANVLCPWAPDFLGSVILGKRQIPSADVMVLLWVRDLEWWVHIILLHSQPTGRWAKTTVMHLLEEEEADRPEKQPKQHEYYAVHWPPAQTTTTSTLHLITMQSRS